MLYYLNHKEHNGHFFFKNIWKYNGKTFLRPLFFTFFPCLSFNNVLGVIYLPYYFDWLYAVDDYEFLYVDVHIIFSWRLEKKLWKLDSLIIKFPCSITLTEMILFKYSKWSKYLKIAVIGYLQSSYMYNLLTCKQKSFDIVLII